MDPSQIIFTAGSMAVTLLHVVVFTALLAIVLLIVAVVLAWRAGSGNQAQSVEAIRRAAELEVRLSEVRANCAGWWNIRLPARPT